MKKIKLGIIGLGYIGKVHLRNIKRIDNADLVAVSDLSKKALKIAKEAGVEKLYTNYENMLKEPEIDAVIISLPTHLHLQCTEKVAEAEKHIFLEKPIARNIDEGKEIVSLVNKKSISLMMGYPLRFNSKLRNLKEKIENGTLGDIEIANASYISSGPFFHRAEGNAPIAVPEWWFKKELTGGGALIDIGCHIINLLRWYFGEIMDIKTHLGYRYNLDIEDSAICLAKFESGTIGNINLGWFSQDYLLEIELFGSVRCTTERLTPPNRVITALQMLVTGKSKFSQSHLSELQYFIDCIINDQPPSPSGEDGLRDIEIISKAYNNQISLA